MLKFCIHRLTLCNVLMLQKNRSDENFLIAFYFVLFSDYSQEAPIIINRMKRTTINANPPPWNPEPDTQFSPFLNGKAVVCIRCYPFIKTKMLQQ
jgi:hypothetical protein